ncbi:hypothetical protein IIB79_12485 [candidate division KSB1 bacterium]|nr:hypothetical protein [candidate division KSB1 bacterium]
MKGEKVSKSKGGLYTVSELEDLGYNALDFRYLSLMTHYRKPLNFSLENLDAARTAFTRLKRRIMEERGHDRKGNDLFSGYEKEFLSAVNDDLNTSKALEIVWRVVEDISFDLTIGFQEIDRLSQELDLINNVYSNIKVIASGQIPEKLEGVDKNIDKKDEQVDIDALIHDFK